MVVGDGIPSVESVCREGTDQKRVRLCYAIEKEIKQVQTKRMNSQVVESLSLNRKLDIASCRTNCPHCGAGVIRTQLMERGCCICGHRPTKLKE